MKLLDLLNFKLEKQSWKMLIHEKKPNVRNIQIEKKHTIRGMHKITVF